jgi:S-DNA-T family DNA segregation ATPase FtsK/SpoIIIE
MLTAGWHAHTLNAPGKFLLSAPGLDHPRRARAYLLTDTDAATTAAHHAPHRPDLDPVSAAALTDPTPADPPPDTDPDDPDADPEAAFWAALRTAPDDGLTVADLIRATGKRRTWIYDRLTHHTHTGRITQTSRGRWRATTDHES